ncbi:CFEM domain-containing protein [Rhexocercosporidium sp. MPI-PUGE-AT-0058]|nr:CFEM domain-containing protein [Rhexocercosporidium sp. MPI-PUGE-AT-0058]
MEYSRIEHLESLRSSIFSRQAAIDPAAPVGNGERFPTSSFQQAGFAILFLFPVIAIIVVALRVYIRRKMKQFGWDDGLIVLAMVLSIAATVAGYYCLKTAFLGIRVADIPPTADPGLGLLWIFIAEILYNPILAIVKTSILLFLLRLGGHMTGIRYAIHSLNVINISLAIAVFITVIFQCRPINFYWDRMRDPTMKGTCIDTALFYVTTAGLTILTDLAALALPFWIFLGLKLSLKARVALMSLFLLGFVVTIAGILRMTTLIEINYHPAKDYTYDIRFCYSAVETNLAIITASGPALRPLLKSWFPSVFGTLHSDGTSQGAYSSKSRTGASRDATKMSGNASRVNTISSKSGMKSQFGTTSFVMKDLKRGTTGIRGQSPSGSEEEIMTYNGIVRTREVDVKYGEDSNTADERSLEDRRGNQTRFDY